MSQGFAFIGIGILVYLGADWVRRLYSSRADNWERAGVIRYGGLSRKVWRKSDPVKFASMIDQERFVAGATRWFMKIFGAIFAISGGVQLLGLLVK